MDVFGFNGDVTSVDLTQTPAATSTIATGTTFFYITATSADGCAYGSVPGTIVKIGPPSCASSPITSSGPQLSLSGPGVTNPASGSSVDITAKLLNVPSPAGTPIFFNVSGANPQIKLVHASADGTATLTYSALHPGTDTVTAFNVTIGSNGISSNPVAFTWVGGKDTGFVSLNGSQEIGPVGQPATFNVNVSDVSQNPPAPVAGVQVVVNVGSQSCTVASTGGTGSGSCQIAPSTGGLLPVSATYAGSEALTGFTAMGSFFAGGPSTTPPSIAPTFTSVPSDTVPSGSAFTFLVTTTGSPTPAITLSPESSLPTGVTLTDNGDGTAALTGTSAVAAGTYTFAIQAANGVSPNATQAFTLQVTSTSVSTTTSLASSVNPSVQHQTVEFTANVKTKSGGGVPIGSVTFTVDGKAKPAVNLSAGKAVFETSALSVGAHKISASYSGAGGFSGSPSPVLTQRVKSFGSPASIIVENGSGQSTTVKTPFSQPLSALVTDAFGNPVSGAVVNFKAPSSGASGVFANGKRSTNVKTGSNGISTTSTFTANSKSGGPYAVAASTGSLAVSFSLTNTSPSSKLGLSIIPDRVTVGGQSTPAFQATVSNQGMGRTTGTLMVTDYLQTGMNFTGGYAITGWQCTFQSQKAICSYTKSIPPGVVRTSFSILMSPLPMARCSTTSRY